MKKFEITITDSAWYPIEAENKEEAVCRALEWFIEREPEIEVKEVEDFE